MTDLAAILSCASVVMGSGALLVRLSPRAMRLCADWLNARADAEDFHKQRFAELQAKRQPRSHAKKTTPAKITPERNGVPRNAHDLYAKVR